jgi:hypothetical protein
MPPPDKHSSTRAPFHRVPALDVTLRACDRNVPDPVYRLAGPNHLLYCLLSEPSRPFARHRLERLRSYRRDSDGAILILHIRHSFGVLRRILLSLCAQGTNPRPLFNGFSG